MNRKFKKVIITGGAGFIGSHLARRIKEKIPGCKVLILDCLTYAGNIENVRNLNGTFLYIDITDRNSVMSLSEINPDVDAIIHLAAESHVDRSIENPLTFAKTNVIGTINMLDLSLKYQEKNPDFIFYHISTDEVFGSLSADDMAFNEDTKYDPRSPYSASKAASDHFVNAYHHTFGLNSIISNCSNNYGPNQYPEKLIPVVVNSLIDRKPIPIYGNGKNIRDWLYVTDHADAIISILNNGLIGETYCIGGDCELTNLELVHKIIEIFDEISSTDSKHLIKYVKDRPGHDYRYSINFDKLTEHTGWVPKTTILDGLYKTVLHIINNRKSNEMVE